MAVAWTRHSLPVGGGGGGGERSACPRLAHTGAGNHDTWRTLGKLDARDFLARIHEIRFGAHSPRAGHLPRDPPGKRPGRESERSREAARVNVARRLQVALLPLDTLKIKAQTSPGILRDRGFLEIFAKEGRGLYRGAGWAAARNAPGSFALFGAASLVKEYVFRLDRPGDASLFQSFAASVAGAVSRYAPDERGSLRPITRGMLC